MFEAHRVIKQPTHPITLHLQRDCLQSFVETAARMLVAWRLERKRERLGLPNLPPFVLDAATLKREMKAGIFVCVERSLKTRRIMHFNKPDSDQVALPVPIPIVN